jgi:hypothetical protein
MSQISELQDRIREQKSALDFIKDAFSQQSNNPFQLSLQGQDGLNHILTGVSKGLSSVYKELNDYKTSD